ncbi:MAG: glucose-6-phosphate isomerase [Demequinaceae bacterium]|nr:glucose-6-phosphate isomerase [Demequinaceae bacterium]
MSSFVSVWAGIDDTAHVAVTASGKAAESVGAHVAGLVADGIASKIAAQDPTLWGPDAVPESSKRMGWVDLHETTREILPELRSLAAELQAEGLTRVVLCGMGGSSLGPEVIAKTNDLPIVVLDSTDPGQVRAALSKDLASTVVVVSSKSGGTVETDSQRRAFEAAFAAVGLDATRHIVVVTDPGSPLEAASREAGYRKVFLADPNVGGRFSVLTAFGLVPAALAGVDVEEILDEAAVVAPSLAEDTEANPALVLGAAMVVEGHPNLVFQDTGSGIVGLGDWAEQLIAESTGKAGVGLLPVVADEAPELGATGVLDVRLVPLADDSGDGDITVAGTLGAQFLVWEYATAIACRILGVGPFDQPDVESAKVAARSMLDASPEPEPVAFVDDGIEVRATSGLLDGVTTVEAAVSALEAQLSPMGYLAVMAYLDREEFAGLAGVREPIAARTGRPITFGWGPRFLHSTGQLHKGGQPVGVFLQITGTFEEDLPIPGRPFTFGALIAAQAAGDANVLGKDHGRPVLRLNLTDRSQVERVRSVLGA